MPKDYKLPLASPWAKWTLAFVLIACIPVIPLINPGCERLYIHDPETGLLRPATPEEAAEMVSAAGDVAKVAAVATGHLEYLPIVDIVVRALAAAAAWYAARQTNLPLVGKPAEEPQGST